MHCFVSGCPNGSNGSKDAKKARMVQIFFSAPEDEALFKQWQNAVPKFDRGFSREDKLCDFHFKKSEVVLFNETKLPNGNVRRLPASEPKLKAGTVPSIFPIAKPLEKSDETPHKTANSQVQKSKVNKRPRSDEPEVQGSTPSYIRTRGRPKRSLLSPNTSSSTKTSTPAASEKKRKLNSETDAIADNELVKDYQGNDSPSEDKSQASQPSIRLVPLETLLEPPLSGKKSRATPQRAEQQLTRSTRIADNKKRKTLSQSPAVSFEGRNAKKKKIEEPKKETPKIVLKKPIKGRKTGRKELEEVCTQLGLAVEEISSGEFEIEHTTDAGGIGTHEDSEIFEVLSIKSDPDDIDQKKTLEELAAELADSGQSTVDVDTNHSSEEVGSTDNSRQPRITEVISLCGMDDGDYLIREKESETQDNDIEREMAKMLGEDSVPSPESQPEPKESQNVEELSSAEDISAVLEDPPASKEPLKEKVGISEADESVNEESNRLKTVLEGDISSSKEDLINNETPEPETISSPEVANKCLEVCEKRPLTMDSEKHDDSEMVASGEKGTEKDFRVGDTGKELETEIEKMKLTENNIPEIDKGTSPDERSTDKETQSLPDSISGSLEILKEGKKDLLSGEKDSITEEKSFSENAPEVEKMLEEENKECLPEETNVDGKNQILSDLTEIESTEKGESKSHPLEGEATDVGSQSISDNVPESSSEKISEELLPEGKCSGTGTHNVSGSVPVVESALEGGSKDLLPEEMHTDTGPQSVSDNVLAFNNNLEEGNKDLPKEKNIGIGTLSIPDNVPVIESSSEGRSEGISPEEVGTKPEIERILEEENNETSLKEGAPKSGKKSSDNFTMDIEKTLEEMNKETTSQEEPETEKHQDANQEDITESGHEAETEERPAKSATVAPKSKKRVSKAKKSKGNARSKKRVNKSTDDPAEDEELIPSSPDLLMSSDSEADPTWAPTADAVEVSDDNDTDPGSHDEDQTDEDKKGDISTKISKTNSDKTKQESKLSLPTAIVPPEVSKLLTQETLQQILRTLKLPVNGPVTFSIADNATSESLSLPPSTKQTKAKEKTVGGRGKGSKTPVKNQYQSMMLARMRNRRVQISVEKSKKCEKLLGIKMFEGLGKIKKAFDFSTFLTDVNDELQFKKFCLVVKECLHECCEAKNAITNIGKLTINISPKMMKTPLPVPDLAPIVKVKKEVVNMAQGREIQQESVSEAEMLECMTVDSNVENHYENTPTREDLVEGEAT